MELKPDQIERLNQSFINWHVNYSVYPYNAYTINELVMQLQKAINDSVILSENTKNLVIALYDWVKGEGLEIEIKKEIQIMIDDGRFNNIINKDIFAELNNKINTNIDNIEKLISTTTSNKNQLDKNTQNIGVHSDNFLKTLYIRENLQKENLNDVIKTGIYNQHSNSNVIEGLNYPLLETSGALIVVGGSDKIFQIYQTYMPNNKLYIRSKYNNEWSNWQDLTNARMLQGKTLSSNNDYGNKIVHIEPNMITHIGSDLYFHKKDNTLDCVLNVNEGQQLQCGIPLRSHEIFTQYLKIQTYGNGENYGSFININAYVNNQNDSGQLLWENVKEFNIAEGSYKGKSILVDNDFKMWNGSLIDMGDDRNPRWFTRRDLKGWQLSDKNLDFWSIFAKSFDVNSDERIKNILNVRNATNNLQVVNSIMPKVFSYIDEPNLQHYGFIAQEVEKYIPSCVRSIKIDEKGNTRKDKNNKDITELKTINPMDLISTLWSATQELSSEVELLKMEIENLKNPK